MRVALLPSLIRCPRLDYAFSAHYTSLPVSSPFRRAPGLSSVSLCECARRAIPSSAAPTRTQQHREGSGTGHRRRVGSGAMQSEARDQREQPDDVSTRQAAGPDRGGACLLRCVVAATDRRPCDRASLFLSLVPCANAFSARARTVAMVDSPQVRFGHLVVVPDVVY